MNMGIAWYISLSWLCLVSYGIPASRPAQTFGTMMKKTKKKMPAVKVSLVFLMVRKITR